MTVFDKILKNKKIEINTLKNNCDISLIRELAENAEPCRNFTNSLRTCSNIPIIAEIKKVSPSMGKLNDDNLDISMQAKMYEQGGASAISVLTDNKYFGGHIDDLPTVKTSVNLPILRKDFILDEIQIYEAKNIGADAILLICAALDDDKLKFLFYEAISLGMTPLIEIHSEEELKRSLKLDPPLLGINNRNLKDLEIDIQVSVKLRALIPKDIFVIGESGIKNKNDIVKLLDAGINGFLIGTTLMQSENPMELLKEFCNIKRS